jgi:hypothetical protein
MRMRDDQVNDGTAFYYGSALNDLRTRVTLK